MEKIPGAVEVAVLVLVVCFVEGAQKHFGWGAVGVVGAVGVAQYPSELDPLNLHPSTLHLQREQYVHYMHIIYPSLLRVEGGLKSEDVILRMGTDLLGAEGG